MVFQETTQDNVSKFHQTFWFLFFLLQGNAIVLMGMISKHETLGDLTFFFLNELHSGSSLHNHFFLKKRTGFGRKKSVSFFTVMIFFFNYIIIIIKNVFLFLIKRHHSTIFFRRVRIFFSGF